MLALKESKKKAPGYYLPDLQDDVSLKWKSGLEYVSEPEGADLRSAFEAELTKSESDAEFDRSQSTANQNLRERRKKVRAERFYTAQQAQPSAGNS